MQIFVLGMHRSGTSAITRLINMMGAAVGPADLLGGPASDNEKGFWERLDVSRLNDSLLESSGCTWDNLHGWPASAPANPALPEWQDAARCILFQMDTNRPWVLKDPRFCITFAFWRELLEVPVCVLIQRSPLEIAYSLRTRNGLFLGHGIALWERYTLDALRYSAGLPRICVTYRELMQDPVALVRRLVEVLSRADVVGLRRPSTREIDAFVEQRLYHERTCPEDDAKLLNIKQIELAAAMADGSALDWVDVPELSIGAREVLEQVHRGRQIERTHAEALAQRAAALAAAEDTNQQLLQEGEGLRATVAQEQQRADDLSRTVDEVQALIEAETARSAALAEELAQAQARHEAETARSVALAEELAQAQARHEAETARSAALATEAIAAAQAQTEGDQRRASELGMLIHWLNEIERLYAATLRSWRWRLGNRMVRLAELLLLRPRPWLAADQVASILAQFGVWQQGRVPSPELPPGGGGTAPERPGADLGASAAVETAQLPVTAAPVLPASVTTRSDSRLTGYRLLCLPIINWDFRFQRPQQLARRFARNGHQVWYTDLEFGHACRCREIEPGVVGVTLPGPAATNVYRDAPDPAQVSSMLDALLELIDAAPQTMWVCIVQLPYWTALAEALRDRTGCLLVYDCMDDHHGFSTNADAMLTAEDRLIGTADLVVASSQLLFDRVQARARRALMVRNAVDYDHFAAVPGRDAPDPVADLTIGYYGAIADWFDSDLVGTLARLRPQWRIVLIGHTFTADLTPLQAQTNIALPGEQPYVDLPGLITDWDCCIIPFLRTPLTEATNPVKVYEMLAAGKPVVAVPLPELVPIAQTGLIGLAETAADFANAIEDLVTSDSRQQQAARRAYAQANTWALRQQQLARAFSDAVPLVSILIVTFNNLALNRQCLNSVLRDTDYPNIEVIVVDNGSRDGTPDLLRRMASAERRIRIILNPDNRGFAAANNQALALARGEFLCLLNNDTIVSGRWLSTLVRHLQRHDRIGLIGPVTNAIGNEAKIPVGYLEIADMPQWAADYCRSHHGELAEIGMLAFFCVVIPRAVYRLVGPLDERFGIGMFEDDDYNDRVRAAGFEVKLARDSFVHHWQRASFKLLGEEEYLRIYRDNKRRYIDKLQLPAAHQQRLDLLAERGAAAARVIIFPPSIGWHVALFQRPHHLARAFAARGDLVIFDCTGSALDDVALLDEIEPNLFLFQGAPDLLRALPRPWLWTFTYNYGYRDHFPADTSVVYDLIDDLSVFPYDRTWLRGLHDRALREATVVAAVARTLEAELSIERTDALYLPNAVDVSHFSNAPRPNPADSDPDFIPLLRSGCKIAGYYGALARWFDWELLFDVAAQCREWQFVLIGPDLDGSMPTAAVGRVPNIHWLGARDYAVLPGYLHHFDVAMIPFRINEITIATSPLKLFEYLAAGRPVLTTAMPECSAFSEVQVAETAADFAAVLPEVAARADDPAFRSRCVALAQQHTWSARIELVIATLARAAADQAVSTPPAFAPASDCHEKLELVEG